MSKSKYTKLSLALLLAFIPLLGVATSAYAAPTAIETAQSNLSAAQAEFTAAQENKAATASALAAASATLTSAQAAKDQAQATYDASAVQIPATLSTSIQNVVQNGTFDTASNWSNIGMGSAATQTNSNIARVYDGVLVGSYTYGTYIQQVGTFSGPVRQVTFSYDMSNNNFNNGARTQPDGYRVEFRTYNAAGQRLNYYNTGDRSDVFPWTHFTATYNLSDDAVRWDIGFRLGDNGYWNGNYAGSVDNVSILANVTTGVAAHTEYSLQATSDLAAKTLALATAQTAYTSALANDAAAVTRLSNASVALSAAQATLAQAQYDAIVPTSAPVISSYTQNDSSVTIYPSLPNNEVANTWFYRVSASDAACSNPYANQTLNTDGAPSSFTINNLTNGCQYQVAVANWNGKSSEYTLVNVAPAAPLVLNTPTNLQVTISGNSAHLIWDAPAQSNTTVERYAVIWSYDNFQSGFGIPSTSTEATITDLAWGSNISFEVRADNDTHQVYSNYSAATSVTIGAEPVPVPVVVPTPTPTPVETPTTTPEPTVAPTVEPTPTPTPIPVDPVPVTPSLYPQGAVFLSADEGQSINYTAPAGYVISNVLFASYGTPNNYVLGECNATGSMIGVSNGITSSSLNVSADNGVFGDPCGGTYKKLEVVLVLAVDPNYVVPTPDPTPTQDPTPTPSPTSDPIVTPDPIVVPTPEPTPTPTQTPLLPLPPVVIPDPQPVVEPSPIPTTPAPQPSPTPTETPSPEPSPSSEPTTMPLPEPTQSSSPEPTSTPVPVPVPVVTPTANPTPEPVSVKEVTKAEDLPTVISAAQLQDIKLDEIVATDLTPEQAGALKDAALQTFETAVAGSPEYAQALDALLVAAKADDIVIDPGLAAIPGVGQAAAALIDAVNLLSNVGADISPVVRAQAQKATVAAVIVGQIAGTAASVATSGSSSSSSSRKNNINRKAK
jgi:Fibronectin type III domain